MHVMLARAAIAMAVIVIMCVGCASEHPRLVTPGEGLPFGLSMWERKGGVPYVMGDEFRVCLDRSGSVTIVDIDLEYNLGLRVDNFAVRPNRTDYPTMDTDGHQLWEYGGYEPEALEVDVVCDEEPQPRDNFHLGVQFSKPSDETARGANLLVTYESEGHTDTLRIQFQLILCETSDYEGECAEWEIEEYKEAAG